MAEHVLQFFSTLNSGGAENRMMDVYRSIDPQTVTFDFAVLHPGKVKSAFEEKGYSIRSTAETCLKAYGFSDTASKEIKSSFSGPN